MVDLFLDLDNKTSDKPPFAIEGDGVFTFIDLFAGVGGFRLALQRLGGRCVFSSEWNADSARTYEANFGERPHGDITLQATKAAIPASFDILCAGFPCQAFSIAGLRKGFDDTRGTLFFDIEEIVAKHRPKVVFLENVKNLVAHDKGKTFRVIRQVLEEKLGYRFYFKVLNSMTHAGIPQNRERIFIVALNSEYFAEETKFSFPEEIPLEKTFVDMLEHGKHDPKLYYNNHAYYSHLSEVIVRRDRVYQWRRVYVRENKSGVCPTLTANMGLGGHNVPLILDNHGIRKLSPRECFNLQGYPKEYILPPFLANSKLYMQAGNSVTVPLIERIGQAILDLLV